MPRTTGGRGKTRSSDANRHRALSPEARENQLIALAYDLAEQQLLDGTISSQVLTQLLKNGSTRGRAELAKLEAENELLKAKKESIQSAQRTDEIYENALRAMQNYSGLEVYEDQNVL